MVIKHLHLQHLSVTVAKDENSMERDYEYSK